MHKNQAFVGFAECARKKLLASSEVVTIQQEIDSLEHEIAACKRAHKSVQDVYHGLQKKIHGTELELKSLEDLERDKKRRLDTTNNVKEYQSLLKEIDQLQEKRSELEESMFGLWQALEEAQENMVQSKQKTEQEMEQLQSALTQALGRRESTEKKSDELAYECHAFAQLVDKDLLALYESMRETTPNPAVPIEQSSCSACFYSVSRSDMIRAERGEIITCKDCYRLLYVVSTS